MDIPAYSEFEEKVVLVTGGAGGIGKEICTQFAMQGAKIVALDVAEPGDLLEVLVAASKAFYQDEPRQHRYSKVNITDEDAVRQLFADVVEDKRYSTVDILVNCAGITGDDLVLRKGADHMKKVMDVNLNGPYILSRELIRLKRKERSVSGRIINIGSVIGQGGNAGQAFYSASKGALHALTKTMADEVARAYHMTEFTVNAVAPGFVETPMTATVKDADREAYIQRIPLGRVAQPIEVAAPVLFLASQGASYITGTVLNVDGGMMRLG